MKQLLLSIAVLSLSACGSNTEQKEKPAATTNADYLLQENSIHDLVTANHQKLNGISGTFKSFKEYLHALDGNNLASITFALDYVTTCIPANSPDKDSVFSEFDTKFYALIAAVSDSLDTKYSKLMMLFDKDSATADLTAFKNNLSACGIGIYDTEGAHYLDVTPDYFYTNFKNRVSESVKEYLMIRKDELKEGFSEDAGLLITFDQLHGRIKRWEKYLNTYPNSIYSNEAQDFYTTYLETLMTGMDNSRVFDFDKNELLPEIKTLYEKIMKEDPASPTTKMITSYYEFLSRHDFKDNDSIPEFLKENDLSGMLAVQPQTR